MSRHDELLQACQDFHADHPEVFVLFEKFTFQLITRGFQHYSAKGIFERIRWETAVPQFNPEGDTEFKLNNNYSAFYARAFMKKHPHHAGFFRTRNQISKTS